MIGCPSCSKICNIDRLSVMASYLVDFLRTLDPTMAKVLTTYLEHKDMKHINYVIKECYRCINHFGFHRGHKIIERDVALFYSCIERVG